MLRREFERLLLLGYYGKYSYTSFWYQSEATAETTRGKPLSVWSFPFLSLDRQTIDWPSVTARGHRAGFVV